MIRGIIKDLAGGVERTVTFVGRFCTFKKVPFVQQYGMVSSPPDNTSAVLIGDGSNKIVIATDDRQYRIELKKGELVLYTDKGSKLHFKDGNVIEMEADSIKIKGEVEFTNKVKISNDVECTGKVVADGIIKSKTDIVIPNSVVPGTFISGKAHTHPVNIANAVTTAPSLPPAVEL